MFAVNRPGIYAGTCVSAGWRKSDTSSARAIHLEFHVSNVRGQDGNWQPLVDGDGVASVQSVTGDWWVIDSKGAVNTTAMEQLTSVLGWDADPESTENGTFPPKGEAANCQIEVKAEKYKDKEYFKATWIYPWTYTGSGGGTGVPLMPKDEVRTLKQQFGAALRAAANPKGAPAGRPKPPPPPGATQRQPASAGAQASTDAAAQADAAKPRGNGINPDEVPWG